MRAFYPTTAVTSTIRQQKVTSTLRGAAKQQYQLRGTPEFFAADPRCDVSADHPRTRC